VKPIDDLQAWAAAYRRAGQPSEELRARILAAVDVRPLPIDRRWRDTAVHACVGALAAIAALVVLGWITRWVSDDAARRDAPSAAPYQQRPSESARPTATPVEPAELAATAPVVATDASGTVPPTRAPSGASREPTDATAPSPPHVGGDLESLRMLRAAKQLLPSDPARAREILEGHARSYPDSALALEREALWIRAACRAGGEPTLAQRRAAFARRPGIAVYQLAIEQDCTAR